MSDSDNNNDFFSVLGDELKAVWQSLADGWRQTAVSLRNGLRQMRRAKIDYVVLELSGPLPERAEPPRSFIERQLPLPEPAFSLEQFNKRVARIADAEAAGVASVPALVIGGAPLHINFGASLADVKGAA